MKVPIDPPARPSPALRSQQQTPKPEFDSMREATSLGRYGRTAFVSIVAATSVHLAACSTGDAQAAGGATNDEDAVTKGAKVYQMYCQGCHGANGKPAHDGGEGGMKPPDLTDDEWKNGGTDDAIFSSIKNGVPPNYAMVPFEGVISDDDIRNVVRYIRSRGKKEPAK